MFSRLFRVKWGYRNCSNNCLSLLFLENQKEKENFANKSVGENIII